MAYDRAFGDRVREHLAALGPIEIKPMFGAASVYFDGRIFALLDDGVIWLKADDENAPDLIAAGGRRFSYAAKDGRTMEMAYWSLPEPAVDDPDEAVRWARAAIEAAARKAARKKLLKPRT